MALDTVAKLIETARVLLQDTIEPYRYDDASLLVGLNAGLLEARRLRPDIFLNNSSSVPEYNVVDTTTVAIDQQFRTALLYYIIGHAQLRDEEDTQDARSSAYLNKFAAQLLVIPS